MRFGLIRGRCGDDRRVDEVVDPVVYREGDRLFIVKCGGLYDSLLRTKRRVTIWEDCQHTPVRRCPADKGRRTLLGELRTIAASEPELYLRAK